MTRTRTLALILAALAVLGAALHPPPSWVILVIIVVALTTAWLWLCRRFPLTAIFVMGFLRGLLGGRR